MENASTWLDLAVALAAYDPGHISTSEKWRVLQNPPLELECTEIQPRLRLALEALGSTSALRL
jgi:hypothetical protein